jgi:hypothetical protein
MRDLGVLIAAMATGSACADAASDLDGTIRRPRSGRTALRSGAPSQNPLNWEISVKLFDEKFNNLNNLRECIFGNRGDRG